MKNRWCLSTLAAIALFALPSAAAESRELACMQELHECLRTNPGQMMMCKDREASCLKGGAAPQAVEKTVEKAAERKTAAKPTPMECSLKHLDCMRKKKESPAACMTLHSKCLAGEVEEEAPAKPKDAPAQGAAAKPAAPEKLDRGDRKDAVCWTINLAMENCTGHGPNACKTLANAFDKQENCARCMKDYRMPMKLQDPFLLMGRDNMKTCKEQRKDLKALEACIKTIKNRAERMDTERYLKAQRRNDEIVAEAKKSGIPGCGNFERMY
jgi:hypothetical protein